MRRPQYRRRSSPLHLRRWAVPPQAAGQRHGKGKAAHGTWWLRYPEPRPVVEGVDFALDSEDGSGDQILEFVPDFDDEGGGAELTSEVSDIDFVPDSEAQETGPLEEMRPRNCQASELADEHRTGKIEVKEASNNQKLSACCSAPLYIQSPCKRSNGSPLVQRNICNLRQININSFASSIFCFL